MNAKCIICGKPASDNNRLPRPLCAKHSQIFWEMLLAFRKQKSASPQLRRRVVSILQRKPHLQPDTIARVVRANPEAVRRVCRELGERGVAWR